MSDGLTVLIPIRQGREAVLLDQVEQLGMALASRNTNGKPGVPSSSAGSPGIRLAIDFPRSRTVHFARLAVLEAPELGPERRRLLYSANFDGSIAEHASDLASITATPSSFWGLLEGYTDGQQLSHFLERHRIPFGAYYRAFPRQSVAELKRPVDTLGLSLRHSPRPLRAARLPPRWLQHSREVKRWLSRVVPLLARLPLTLWVLLTIVLRHGLVPSLRAARDINQGLGRVAWIRVFNWAFSNRPAAGPEQSLVPVVPSSSMVPVAEDRGAQNELTLLMDIPETALARLRVALALIDLYARYLSPPGSLVGISTIHFVRWMIVDDGRRLLMASDYDGSWESYIDEFAVMIWSGLEAIWQDCVGFPEQGARDVFDFKRFLHLSRVHCQAFYSAYPRRTVLSTLARKI